MHAYEPLPADEDNGADLALLQKKLAEQISLLLDGYEPCQVLWELANQCADFSRERDRCGRMSDAEWWAALAAKARRLGDQFSQDDSYPEP